MLVTLSFWLFGIAFFSYLAATLLYGAGLIGARQVAGRMAAAGGGATVPLRFGRASDWAYRFMVLGTAGHAAGILLRWQGAGHWPTSNMYEFIGFMTFTTTVAFHVIYRLYRLPVLGLIMAPLAMVIFAYSYVFPREIKPLIPALQSHWLYLHVSTVAAGEGFFAVAFGAALLYLLRTREEGESPWGARFLEGLFWLGCVLLSFILLGNVLRNALGLQWTFTAADGTVRSIYHLPPLIGPAGARVGELGTLPLLVVPESLRGRNWNTLVYALGAGTLLYGLIRYAFLKGRPFRVALQGIARNMDPELLDEVSYRSVAIGYPLFTLGGLVFAMIWAKEAWGRYWFWDPKETWAFIAWLVYSGYLHLRINRGWEGRPSAWTAVVGFGVVLFTLIGVNLLIVGLHAYAGGD